jgi:hypothetical protein
MEKYQDLTALLEDYTEERIAYARAIMDLDLYIERKDNEKLDWFITRIFRFQKTINFLYILNDSEPSDADMFTTIELMDGTIFESSYGYPVYTLNEESQDTLILQVPDPDEDDEQEPIDQIIALDQIKSIALSYDT